MRPTWKPRGGEQRESTGAPGGDVLPIGIAVEHDQAMPMRIVTRGYFSTYWLWAAQHFVTLAGEVEARHERGSRFSIEHRAYILAAINACVAFLEAMVNELFQDALDGHLAGGEGAVASLTEDSRRTMSELWRATDAGHGLAVLGKYEVLLALCGKEAPDKGAEPYQSVASVVRVRNAITHYLPADLAADTPHGLERQLRGRFADNRLMAESGNAWWPDKALGHGCAKWAYKSVRALADRVVDEIDVRPHYRRHEEQGGWDSEPGAVFGERPGDASG